MFERFTERARQVVVLSQEEARTMKHGYIGTEHLLLGLIREEEGLAAKVLESLGVTVEPTRTAVTAIVGVGKDEQNSPQIPFTPRAKTVLEMALREALSLGHNYVGTEHIALGLVREGNGVGARILTDMVGDLEKVRNEIIRMLSGPGLRKRKTAAEIAAERLAALEQENDDLRAEIIALKLHARSLAEELSGAWWIRAADALRALTDLADDTPDVYVLAAQRIAGDDG